MKVLIVRLSSMGDVIHALPVAANARRSGAEVAWAVEDAYRELVEPNPDVDRAVVADTRGWRRSGKLSRALGDVTQLFDRLREFRPDVTIDAQGLWKSALVARAAGAPVVGFSAAERRETASALLCDRPVEPMAGGHVVDRNLALVEAAGIPVERRAPDARFLLEISTPDADEFLARQRRPYVVFHPGAGRPEKAWGDDRFAALASRVSGLGFAPVVSWGPGDEDRVRAITGAVSSARAVPQLSIAGLARVLSGAALVVAGDTGPLHLADALGARTLALFGPTDPARNGPYRGLARAVRWHDTAPDEVARLATEALPSGESRPQAPPDA